MRSYRTSSNYTSNSYNAGISSSPKTTTTTSGGGGQNYNYNQYTAYPQKQKTKAKPKKKTIFTPDNTGQTAGAESGNNTITQVTKTAPTIAEVSQVTTADAAAEDTEANRLLKIKKRGRSKSILSGSQGVTKMAADYSLGKKSLLGRV